jgi:hypothetical protein
MVIKTASQTEDVGIKSKMVRWLNQLRGKYKLIKVTLYLYRQGKPWNLEGAEITQRQAELLDAAKLVLDLKDNL